MIAPLQLSVAVNEIIAGTSSAQATVTAAGASGIEGTIVSFLVNVALVVEIFPHASVAVNVTMIPVEQSPEILFTLFDQVTLEQLSDA